MRVEGSHEMEIVNKGVEQSRDGRSLWHVATFRTSLVRGAEIVAAVWAEADPILAAGAEDGAKAQ